MSGSSSSSKTTVSVVVIGHVDSGKSTTTGHLLYKCGAVDPHVLERFEKEATESGKGSFKYAWILDKLKSERERGITIDISSWQFQTPRHSVTVIDAPGHRDFIKNMMTGVAQADAGILVVNASQGGFEAGMSPQGQTREHALLAFTLGISKLVVAINKMDDKTVAFAQQRYEDVRAQTLAFLKKVGYQEANVTVVPISGWTGDNIFEKSANMPWYKGSTLIEAIDTIDPPQRAVHRPLRIPVQQAMQVAGVGTVILGRVESGSLEPGQSIVVAPAGVAAEVKSIEMHRQVLKKAVPGDIIGFNIKARDGKSITRGMVVGDAKTDPPLPTEAFDAQIIVLNHPGEIGVGYAPVIDCGTAHVACRMEAILKKMDSKTGKNVVENPSFIKAGDAALVTLRPTKPVCVEPYSEYPALGRFALRDMRQTVAVGVIKKVVRKGGVVVGGKK